MATKRAPVEKNFIERLSKLYSGVVADALDKLGYRDQVLDPAIRPIWPEAVVAGRCHTVSVRAVYEVPETGKYEGEIKAVEAIEPGDVVVAMVQGSSIGGFWGELVSTAAQVRGGLGAVVDGYVRDTARMVRMGFPVFTRGYSPADALGRIDVEAHGIPIVCGGVHIDPKDYIFGDRDGVVAIPAAVAGEAIARAEEKVRTENDFRRDLLDGKSLHEVYRRLGIL